MTLDPRNLALAYAGLEPTAVLDALDALGLRGDGRLLQLNSYENRVYLAHLEADHIARVELGRKGHPLYDRR